MRRKFSHLRGILDDLKMKFEAHHDIYLLAGQCWHTHWFLYKKKTSEKKFDVNTRYPTRARWNFRGLLDDSLFLYLEFDMNKRLKNWGNYEILRIEFGGFIVTIVTYVCTRTPAFIVSHSFF